MGRADILASLLGLVEEIGDQHHLRMRASDLLPML